jgi:hypothetical protein
MIHPKSGADPGNYFRGVVKGSGYHLRYPKGPGQSPGGVLSPEPDGFRVSLKRLKHFPKRLSVLKLIFLKFKTKVTTSVMLI